MAFLLIKTLVFILTDYIETLLLMFLLKSIFLPFVMALEKFRMRWVWTCGLLRILGHPINREIRTISGGFQLNTVELQN